MLHSLLLQSDAENAGTSVVGVIFALLFTALAIVAYWKIYTKAGQPGWASIIPIYNVVVLLRIVGKPWWWLLLMLIPFVNLVIAIIVLHRLSLVFGHGTGFTLGLIFLAPIFMLILAFGDSRYGGVAIDGTPLAQPA